MPAARYIAFAPLILCFALNGLPSESRAQQKATIPDAAAQEKAKKAAGEIYGGRFRQVKSSTEKTALAAEILEAAENVQTGSPDQYMLLKIAGEIASGAGDASTALQAVEKLVERFDVAKLQLTAETLLTAARNAATTSQYKAIGEAALSLSDSLTDADEYELALALCESARSPAQRTRLFALAKDLTVKIEDIEKQQAAFQEFRDAWAVLEKDPTNPAANLAAGRYLCFVKGDWGRGVAMLALGSDAEVKAAAVKDLRGGNSAEDQAAIGDAWWDLAQGRAGAERETPLLRAGFWYRQTQGNLEGLARIKVQQRIEQLRDEIPDFASSEPVPVGEIHCFEGENHGVFSPDGRWILTSSRDNALRLWDVGTRREIRSFVGHAARSRLLCFVPKGDRIVSAGDDHTIRVWDTETARELKVIKVAASPQKMRIQAVVATGGKRLLWCGEDGRVHVTDLETGKDLYNLDIRRGRNDAYVVAFSQDGQWALTGGLRSTSLLWHLATGQAADLKANSQAYAGALSPDGQFALTGGWDKILLLWRLPQRVEIARYLGHGGHIYAATFSPEGGRILSGDGSCEVRLWDTKTTQELHCYRGHTQPISRVCFSPDGRYGLSSGDDDTVRLLGLP